MTYSPFSINNQSRLIEKGFLFEIGFMKFILEVELIVISAVNNGRFRKGWLKIIVIKITFIQKTVYWALIKI